MLQGLNIEGKECETFCNQAISIPVPYFSFLSIFHTFFAIHQHFSTDKCICQSLPLGICIFEQDTFDP